MFDKIAVLVGMPRSGTSWLSQIVDSSPNVRFRLSPFFSYAFKNAVNEHSSKAEYERVFEGAYRSDNEFMDQTERRRMGQYPVFPIKEKEPEWLVMKMERFHHLHSPMLQMFDNMKMVAIIRHPCGAIHSWISHPKEFPGDADPMKEWRTGACRKKGPEEFWGFEDWKKTTRLYLHLERSVPERFLIVRYEDLVTSAVSETKRLFGFLGIELTAQTEKFVEDSQTRHDDNPYAVFKNPTVKDKWKAELHPLIQEEILRETAGTELQRFVD